MRRHNRRQSILPSSSAMPSTANRPCWELRATKGKAPRAIARLPAPVDYFRAKPQRAVERSGASQIAPVVHHEAHMRAVYGVVPASTGEAQGIVSLRDGRGLEHQHDQPAHARQFAIVAGFDRKRQVVQRSRASPQGLFARQRFLGHKRNMGYATRFNRAIGSLSGWNSPAGSRLACSQR